MRRIYLASLLAGALSLASCKNNEDPNRFETHIEKLKTTEQRDAGFTGLEALTKRVVTADNEAQLQEFVVKVIPTFADLWDDAVEQRTMMLELLRDVGDPAAAEIWSRAIEVDGSSNAREHTILALQGVQKADAVAAVDAITAELDKLLAKPELDEAEREVGKLRLLMVETLGDLGDAKAVPVLIDVMEQPPEQQPVAVHRAAAKALGFIADPAAVDALLAVTFRVPDRPSTTDIGQRSQLALAAIGEPVVPKAIAMLRGEHELVQKVAAEHGVGQETIQLTAARILGVLGSSAGVDELVAFMPKADCGTKVEPTHEAIAQRAVFAKALGLIGDAEAVEPLCACVDSSRNPTDMFPILEALGRIGGSQAVQCLARVVREGAYDDEVVAEGFVHKPRWEAARFAILAAQPSDVQTVSAAIESNREPDVVEKLKQWQAGLDLLKTCREDVDCYVKTLDDGGADWFSREKAATEIARLAAGDAKRAAKIAEAFKVRNPDARVTMALLPPKMLDDEPCPACIEAYQTVLRQERDKMDRVFQASVIRVRQSIAKLRAPGVAPDEADESDGG